MKSRFAFLALAALTQPAFSDSSVSVTCSPLELSDVPPAVLDSARSHVHAKYRSDFYEGIPIVKEVWGAPSEGNYLTMLYLLPRGGNEDASDWTRIMCVFRSLDLVSCRKNREARPPDTLTRPRIVDPPVDRTNGKVG